MRKTDRRNLPPQPIERRNMITIGEYLKYTEARKQFLGRIAKGKMKILFYGKWITQKQFDKVMPPIIMPDFLANLNNVDTTKLWMHQ